MQHVKAARKYLQHLPCIPEPYSCVAFDLVMPLERNSKVYKYIILTMLLKGVIKKSGVCVKDWDRYL